MIVDVIVEMPKYGKYKYRYENGAFKKIRKLVGLLPENYGCIVNTLAPDNSMLDAIILTNKPLKQGRIIHDISAKRLETIIGTWTGHPGQTSLKRIADSREAARLVEKYRI
ncbi:MAG: inorganic diphosphatase [Nanoarchaeota archaeon]|nr:inorganic diphosphatase [Nanoarchaeota archaeon]